MANSTTRQSPPTGSALPLSDLQLELLKLYSTDVSSQDLLEVKSLLGRYFGRKAAEGADRIWDERELTNGDMDSWLHD